MAELDCEIAEITPEVAKEILEKNTRNRTIRQDYVLMLAGAMKRGEWQVNGEPIQIGEDGTLLNGQHRLSAVVESGVPVSMVMVRGLPVKAQMNMDTGTRRHLSDVLTFHGETETTNLGAMLGMLYRYRKGYRFDNSHRTAPTATEALALLEEEPGIKDGIPLGRRVFKKTKLRVSITALFVYLFDEVDPPEGTRFFEALCNVDAEPPGSAIRAFHSILVRSRSERTYRISTYVLSAMVIKTFNAWREGRDIALMTFRPGGDKPEPYPEIRTRAEVEGRMNAPEADTAEEPTPVPEIDDAETSALS
jgi:hypothetical protein